MKWIRNHKITVFLIAGALIACANGGKVYTSAAAGGSSNDVARLAANRMTLGVFAFFLVVAAIFARVRRLKHFETKGKTY